MTAYEREEHRDAADDGRDYVWIQATAYDRDEVPDPDPYPSRPTVLPDDHPARLAVRRAAEGIARMRGEVA